MKIEINKDKAKEFVSGAGGFAGSVAAGVGLALGSEVIKACMPRKLKWLGTAFWVSSIIPAAATIVKHTDDIRPYTDAAVDGFADIGEKIFSKVKKTDK